ncbi:hypothetical protein [Paenibacillus sp. KS-LC4]|uniref:hypothetical protein n=1 Tax=Paenibacillus sp. KS-LC4 TaxID=2979727 RepID=UPI0030D1DE5E
MGNNSKWLKLLGLIGGVVALNIVILSPGLVGVVIGGESVLATASGVTLLVSSFLTLTYGSYMLLLRPASVPQIGSIATREDFMAALSYYKNVKVLHKDIALSLDQLERIAKKRAILSDILGQRFEQTEISYKKFDSVIAEVEKLFYLNIKAMLNKLGVFDANEFASLERQRSARIFSNKLMQEKIELYQQYLDYVSGYLGANEEILLKLDRLALEISLLGSADYKAVEEMPCMKELDVLIKQTKLYQQ